MNWKNTSHLRFSYYSKVPFSSFLNGSGWGGGVMGVNAYYIPQDGKERKGHFKYNTQG